MTSYTKIARGFFQQLTALFALYGVLGMSLAVATPRPPYNCPGNQPCPIDGGLKYRIAVAASTTDTNQEVSNQSLTTAQWKLLATDLHNAYSEGLTNGMWRAVDQLIANNVALFEAAKPDYSKIYPIMYKNGFKGTEQQIVGWAEKTSQSDRIAFVNAVLYHGGIEAQIVGLIAMANTMAGGNKFVMDCHAIAVTGATAAMYGGILALIPGGEGAALLSGAVGLGFGLAYVLLHC
jgi:ketosteroid isomerase-like protein